MDVARASEAGNMGLKMRHIILFLSTNVPKGVRGIFLEEAFEKLIYAICQVVEALFTMLIWSYSVLSL